MNFNTQIKCAAAALALFAAVGVAALTSAAATRVADDDARAHVKVGAPITVGANPTAEDIERASR